MYRSHTCGELRITDAGKTVKLCGWVHKARRLGGATFIDLRDRYGITQLTFLATSESAAALEKESVSREMVIQAEGKVVERENKNRNLPTGEIEIKLESLTVLNKAATPPFTIEDETDGGDELRMKYRYLDLRRTVVRRNLELRHRMALETRKYLDQQNFLEVETPVLIKSTPEGARDFVVPSRMNAGQFYALPQSPQTFKQLLMVSGFDRYYQIVKCFRDEDLRADRQPEFTQIDCEMSFVEQEDIIQMFEGLVKHLFKVVKDVDIQAMPRLSYADAMKYYGNDKPDTRFEMRLSDLSQITKGKGFKVFDDAETVLAISVAGAAEYSRKQIDELTEWVKRPQIGATGLVYARVGAGNNIKSSVDKFYSQEDLAAWAGICGSKENDLILVLAGPEARTRKAASELRLEMAERTGLRDRSKFSCLWVTDFPLLEWNEGDPNLLASLAGRWHAKHHPFTSPKPEDIGLLQTDPGAVRANAYDMVINGVEVGGGSIRIHDRALQERMFEVLGFTKEEAVKQFGFLMNAFEFGAPPHGGIAFGFDRLCAVFAGADSIRDFIAFPKNNAGRDMMIDAPSEISKEQLNELNISLK